MPPAMVRQVITESGKTLQADMVVMSIGVRPNVALAQAAGLQLGSSGAIFVDEYQRTSDPDIYAVGDAAEVIHAVTGRSPFAFPSPAPPIAPAATPANMPPAARRRRRQGARHLDRAGLRHRRRHDRPLRIRRPRRRL